ncbi:MAG TPA: hypothetical protein DD670_06620 [Planctomycetaceae bacterium]|nr:hypothetical protein [Planctomycetaceae bacterium]
MFWLLAIIRFLLGGLDGRTDALVRTANDRAGLGTWRDLFVAPRRSLSGVGRDPNDGGMRVGPVLNVCVVPLEASSAATSGIFARDAWGRSRGRRLAMTALPAAWFSPPHAPRFGFDSV